MDLKDPKTQKLVLAGIGVFLLGYLWYAKIYQGYEQKIQAHAQRYEQIQMELKNVEMKFRSMDALKAEYRDLTGRYRHVERLLPEAQNVPDLLSEIHSAALESNSEIVEIQPMGVAPKDFYNMDSYRVVINTTFHDLGWFLADIANFPFIVNIEELQMQELLQDNAEAMPDEELPYTITASLKLTSYYVQESEKLVLYDL